MTGAPVNEWRGRLGIFSLTGSPVVCELAGACGFDFVIVDCEHSETSPFGQELAHLVRAVVAGGATPLVRLAANDSAQMARALDLGAQAVIVPQVNDTQAARAAVAAAWRPPAGHRGAAPVVRAARYSTRPWPEFVGEEPQVIALIETPAAVAQVEAIADVTGLGMLMFGAFDLAVAMGFEDPRASHDEIEAARRRVYAAAGDRGLGIADYAWQAQGAQAAFASGAHAVALSTDISLLASSLSTLRAEVQR